MLSGLKFARGNPAGKCRSFQKTFFLRRSSSPAETSANAVNESLDPPTRSQLVRVFWHAAVPMIGFGIMDQVSFEFPGIRGLLILCLAHDQPVTCVGWCVRRS
jgi:hypothetical protein